jgi:NAD(P)-dependent dehydrogenase (short-subunit alcohol dehydrogenase family)
MQQARRESMSEPLERPVALVTGGRRGIGRGCALALADAGFDLVIVDLERDADAEQTLAAIEQRGGHGAFLTGDIAALGGHDALVDAAFDAFGRLDCLVNNAGVGVLSRGDLLDVSVESYDRCLATNLRGTFFLTQAVARRMLQVPPAEGSGPRSIVTITSVNAEIASTSRGEYCISTAGASMLTRLFALRLAPHGIAVYEVRPGVIRTAMTAPVAERYQAAIDGGLTPISRWGEPADIGRSVATLATGGLAFNVGQVVYVDGGLNLPAF